MRVETIAQHLRARRTGEGRWMARCPAHPDRAPSLSIWRGRKGTVLHCFAGCDIRDILIAAGLRFADLFDGAPATPAQLTEMNRERAAQAAVDERRRRSLRSLEDNVTKLAWIRNELGAKLAALANVPEGDELDRLFHQVCDMHRAAAVELEQYHAEQRRAAGNGSLGR